MPTAAPTTRAPLTGRQAELLALIGRTIATRFRPPTLREMAAAMRMSGHSTGPMSALAALQKKGYLRVVRTPKNGRRGRGYQTAIVIDGLSAAVGPAITAHVSKLIRESRP